MKPGLVSGSPQDGAGMANSLIILNTPMTRPTMRPQNAPGSLVNSVKIPITKTVTTGGPRYDVIALARDHDAAERPVPCRYLNQGSLIPDLDIIEK